MNSINYRLEQLASDYYIKFGSTEQKKIDSSVGFIKTNLKKYFGNSISGIIEFGSYRRDTILPRRYDDKSDVDLMVVFQHSTINILPGAYRQRLLKFCESNYSKSEVYRSAPTVVLQLEHINYDLVPSYQETSIYHPIVTTYIPENDNSWMRTDPNGFNSELTKVNSNNYYHIKKVIRLLKAWNAKAGYPLNSFSLEKEIAAMSFFFMKNALEDYFFYAIENMSPYVESGFFVRNIKIDALKENLKKVRSALSEGNLVRANLWLSHILPM